MSEKMMEEILEAWEGKHKVSGMSIHSTRHLDRLVLNALFFGAEYRQSEIDALNAKINTLIQQNEGLRWKLRISVEALENASEHTRYNSEDDEIGERVCCGVISCRKHADNCYILKALAQIKED